MKTRKINPFLISYILGLAVLACLGYTVGDFTAQMQKKNKIVATNPHFATDVGFIDLPRMNLTLPSAAGKTGRVRLDMTLEVDKQNMSRFEDYQPIITDRLVKYVRQLDAEDLHRPNAAPVLRKELLQEVNSISAPMPVIDIVFRQFLIM